MNPALLPESYQLEVKQRQFDGKWLVWGYVNDPHYNLQVANSLIPKVWVPLAVCNSRNAAERKMALFPRKNTA